MLNSTEKAAIIRLRENHPNMPQRKLARKIVGRSFMADKSNRTACQLIGCTFASVYAFIRRNDWQNRQALVLLALAA